MSALNERLQGSGPGANGPSQRLPLTRRWATVFAVTAALLFALNALPDRAFSAGNSSSSGTWDSGSFSGPSNPSTTGSSASSSIDPESRPLKEYQSPGRTTPQGDTGGLVVDVLGKLSVVVVLILACAAGWRKFQQAAGQRVPDDVSTVHVTGTVALAPQRFLHVVTVGQQRLLVGSSPQQICLITRLDTSSAVDSVPEEPGAEYEDHSPETDRFEHLLHRLREVEGDGATERQDRRGDGVAGRRGDKSSEYAPAARRPVASSPERPVAPWTDERPRARRPEPSPSPEAEIWSGSMTPGSLFRTSSEAGSESGRP